MFLMENKKKSTSELTDNLILFSFNLWLFLDLFQG